MLMVAERIGFPYSCQLKDILTPNVGLGESGTLYRTMTSRLTRDPEAREPSHIFLCGSR
jgi:hypothetical protein